MGFTIDYLRLLAKKTGIEFVMTPGTWKDNLRKFKQHKIDVITAISYTQERTSFTNYTTPYYLIPTVVYTSDKNFDYNGVADLEQKTVGIEADVFYKKYLQEYPEINIREIEDTNKLLRKLSFGELDAVITNINIGNYMIKKHMLNNVKLAGRIDIPEIEDEDLRFGINKEKPRLHSIIQNGINRITPNEYKALQDRWVGFSPDEIRTVLMPGDQKLIDSYNEKYGGIRISSQCSWRPIDFLNEQKNHKGIAASIFKKISDQHDIPFILHKTDSFESAIEELTRGNCDLLPAVVPSPELREKMSFTKPYLSLSMVLATKTNEFFVGSLNDISGKKIGMMNQGEMKEIFTKKYPHLTFEPVDSVKKGLEKVRSGENFGFIGTIPTIADTVQNDNFYNIKISGKLDENLLISAAVRSGDRKLLNLMNNLLGSISMEQKKTAVNRWISLSLEEKIDYRIVWRIAGGVFILAVIAAIWLKKVHSLNSRISEANQLLEEKNKELERVSVTDHLTGLFNRSKADEELFLELEKSNRYGENFSIIILDVDHFKSINDEFGHQSGDLVLEELSETLKQRLRATDIAARWGGEEFLIICPQTDRKGALQLAENIRHTIENHTSCIDQALTISCGVAEHHAGESIQNLIRKADENLYKAKNSGRNQVI